jgi:hypothetical protein
MENGESLPCDSAIVLAISHPPISPIRASPEPPSPLPPHT